ncbi:hypothetical protein FCL47_06150 [Desulfopila sp. IMCC35006]|uniref:hypothetical protein n=1 Tax=Desulfopila sp. IMCC35006 TaxID=2569542 RepID=UPI0010AC4E13|nr:hypothetical protein [Desulfopila sp. IMCC35006]TKB27708.1 hypothetical protein FCL47_06150 [Desulfopila sp. IMCC35006]
MHNGQKICLRCKYFRLESVDAGLCRVDKDTDKNYPVMDKNDHCLKWRDCGQQYFIRLGWIKAKTNELAV